MSKIYVLDSFAILALINGEQGSDVVADLLNRAQTDEAKTLMSWVNVGEVAYIVERRSGVGQVYQVLGNLETTKIDFVDADRTLTLAAAHLKAQYPLSYADAFAAALAVREKAILLTGDPEFRALEKELTIQWLV
ncbi:MAG: type II toxin-antitoxin system VapC family toxin [Anaerolineae bacterium]